MAGRIPGFLAAERETLSTRLGQELLRRLPLAEVRERITSQDYADFGSDRLVLTRHRGSFVKPCPGTKGYICCGLEIIHFGLGCSLGCSYCILQAYLDTEALVLFGNVDEGLAEVESRLAAPSFKPARFCTGEFTDSLLLEDLTGLAARLVLIFSKTPHLLELKTKTADVKGLLDLDHGRRTLISFSVNAPEVARQEETRAAPLGKRIEAAGLVVRAGYRVGFHFDPIIRHPGWEDGYARTVEEIFRVTPADRIAWFSLGAFRYLPRLKAVVRRRHPRTRIMDEEFILAEDGKMRYLRPLRVEMYRRLLELIRQYDPAACVYLCMESPRVWREVFDFDPGPEGLIRMLDDRLEDVK
ncbi:MAG: spore photoproduct lyase family protein [Thermodesulfobacteriota bacterium]